MACTPLVLGNQPAAHVPNYYTDAGNDHFGITKRELFAAMAMQGFLSAPNAAKVNAPADMLARDSLLAADALLEALSEAQP